MSHGGGVSPTLPCLFLKLFNVQASVEEEIKSEAHSELAGQVTRPTDQSILQTTRREEEEVTPEDARNCQT